MPIFCSDGQSYSSRFYFSQNGGPSLVCINLFQLLFSALRWLENWISSWCLFFSVSRCSRNDLHRFWLPHDILEEVSFILHCQYWQIPAFEILDHLVVKCSTFGPHTCVSRSVSSFSSTIIQQTWTIKITFIAVFILRYGLSAVSLNMLLSAVAIEVCFYF